jgi:hypothetical protein
VRERLATGWRRRRVRLAVYALLGAGVVAGVVAAGPSNGPHDNGPLPVLAGPRAVSHIDPLLSRTASALAGRRLEVRCWSASDWHRRAAEVKSFTRGRVDVRGPWTGYTSRDRKRANLGPNACDRLAALAYDHVSASSYDDAWWLAWSVGLFAHETQSDAGNKVEAECSAMQRIVPAGVALGLTQRAARRLSRLFWTDIYPREAAKLRSPECRPGGELDLDPADPGWP